MIMYVVTCTVHGFNRANLRGYLRFPVSNVTEMRIKKIQQYGDFDWVRKHLTLQTSLLTRTLKTRTWAFLSTLHT